MALCPSSLGELKNALELIDNAIRFDTSAYVYVWVKGDPALSERFLYPGAEGL